jgi:hypothetical protein
MGWFGFGKKKKWAEVLPMLYPFDLDMSFAEDSELDPAIVESNRVSSLQGPLGLKIYLLKQTADGAARMVSHGNLKEWGIDLQSLLSESIANLENQLLKNVEPTRLENCDENIACVNGAANYTASLILSEQLFPRLGFSKKDIAIAIPHRDFLYFGSVQSDASIAKLAEIAADITRDLCDDVPDKHMLFNGVAKLDHNSDHHWSIVGKR